MPMTFAPPSPAAIPLFALTPAELDDFTPSLTDIEAAWFNAHSFKARFGQVLVLPGADGAPTKALAGLGNSADLRRNRFALGAARAKLPGGIYELNCTLPAQRLENEYLGWLLAGYKFDRYKSRSPSEVQMVAPPNTELASRVEALAAGEGLTRDLINTPASDMGPPNLAAAARAMAAEFGAQYNIIQGDDLLTQNFPLIHTVGRAADRAPRLIDMRWGNAGPALTLVGKGVCFDTGGLNLKPGGSMGLMKKDMGGAATVLGLAQMIMALNMPLRLRVLVPAVENSVAGNAFRPQDILPSRKGLTVEINNTDAEGRLVLADALTLADEETPDLVVSMATLTGAARVAVGPDIAPFYTNYTQHAQALTAAADAVADPVWQMPFHDAYEAMIEPGIADLDNAPKGGFAGSITAALFLRRFVTDSKYMHFDVYGWQPSSAPSRPKGGVGQGARALLAALPDILKF